MAVDDRYAFDATTSQEYYATRYRENLHRDRVWKYITEYLVHFWQLPKNSSVLELGCGYGSWIRRVPANRRVALDVNPALPDLLRQMEIDDVEAHVGKCTDLSTWSDRSFDLVLASNLLEHLTMHDVLTTLRETARVLRPAGRVCLVQPNFALCPREYFDDYTHVSIFTDRSLADVLTIAGLEPLRVWRRFLPFSMKPATSRLSFLVPIYLRSPWKPFAGQMCFIARKSHPSSGN